MISVCIPVYRFNARSLVRELLRQRAELENGVSDFEILLYDDASPDDGDWGKLDLREIPGIRYVELPANLGRAAIRNRMIRDANGTHCILLDADAGLPQGFLLAYEKHLFNLHESTSVKPGADLVVVGGRKYSEQRPPDPKMHLHWWYGRQRESDVNYSDQQGWLGFHSNNFLATRSLLLNHPFPESVDGYGHEDTLWGQQFTGSDTPFFRIDNPVVHLGLEPGAVFLRKQQEAIRNLHRLKNETPHLRTRLIDLVEKYPKLTALAKYTPEKPLINYLTSRPAPNLKALDLLKLKWWVGLA